ncbi:MAG: hypothetical protein IKM59_04240 [Oscillospiraceae bacterium]|nr:hypothetical protein [Oscillospiraceae bacterium]
MRAGFGRVAITPHKPMKMAGFDRRKDPSSGILDELYVSVLRLEDESAAYFAFCSFDVLGVDSQLCRQVRNILSRSLSVDADRIWVSSTHTHSAPSHIFSGSESYDPDFVSELLEKAKEAGQKAKADLAPCAPYVAHTHAVGVASLRNMGRSGSEYPMPVHVTKLCRKEDSLSFCLFSCHPTVLDEKNTLYSKDIPGAAAKRLPKNQFCMFHNGACADISTRFTRTASSPEELKRLGGILGDAIVEAPFSPGTTFGTAISCAGEDIFLSRGAGVDGEERLQLLEALHAKMDACEDPQMKREYDSRIAVLERAAAAAEKDRRISVSAVDFGPFMYASLPFEVDSKDGIELETILTEAAGKPVYLICYTGGYDGYLPSGNPLTADSSYEDFASRYLPQSRRQVWESAKKCVLNAKI